MRCVAGINPFDERKKQEAAKKALMAALEGKKDILAENAATFDVLRRMREDILCCVLKPDQRLRFGELRQRYGTSVGTLREALSHLVSEGLARTETGRGKYIVCPYHGWTFDLTGRLVGITDGAWFGDVDKPTHGLKPLAVAERCGLVFVLPAVLEPGQNAELDMDGFLGPVKDDLKSWDMQTWEVQSTTPLRPRMNWKLVIDTFLELYHFRYLHGKSVAPLFLDNITSYERRGRHSRFAVCKPSILEVENQPREDWRLRDHAVVLYNLFPNTVLAYTADHCGVFTSYPVTPDESLINVSILVDPVERAKRHEKYWETNQNLILAALDEDFTVGATIQANFRSGANKVQTFGKFEKALGWYHEDLTQALA